MDSLIYLVVEGIGDRKLLTDLVLSSFGKSLHMTDNFLVTNGYGANWINKHKPQIEIAQANGMNPVIVADADGNFQQRRAAIVAELTSLNLSAIPYFLLPDNASNGKLEDLLFSMMLHAHAVVNTCFDQYRNCLPSAYSKPTEKVKVYSYAAAVLPVDKIKLAQDEKRDYTDNSIWNLNSAHLLNLKTFLQKHI